MADLGGSEQVKKSKVDAGVSRLGTQAEHSVGFQMGDRMREAVYINLGLLALKKCIEALNNEASYVPYSDSKLTMLLSTGLGGDSKTSVVVCGNMDTLHAGETMASMRFGERCASVEVEARNNATMLAGVLSDIDRQIGELEEAIRSKERWESR
jgi:kinesin family protein 5